MKKKDLKDFCKSKKCKEYIEWDCGYGLCYSCKLQGESYDILKLADNCPYRKGGSQ